VLNYIVFHARFNKNEEDLVSMILVEREVENRAKEAGKSSEQIEVDVTRARASTAQVRRDKVAQVESRDDAVRLAGEVVTLCRDYCGPDYRDLLDQFLGEACSVPELEYLKKRGKKASSWQAYFSNWTRAKIVWKINSVRRAAKRTDFIEKINCTDNPQDIYLEPLAEWPADKLQRYRTFLLFGEDEQGEFDDMVQPQGEEEETHSSLLANLGEGASL